MTKPIILAVDDRTDEAAAIEETLARRYGADYEILAEAGISAALQRLDELRAAPAPVVLVVAALEMAEMAGAEFLDRAQDLHPHARRLLLIPWDRA